jgi:hypothetical protein
VQQNKQAIAGIFNYKLRDFNCLAITKLLPSMA